MWTEKAWNLNASCLIIGTRDAHSEFLQYHAWYCFDTEKVWKGVNERKYKHIKIWNKRIDNRSKILSEISCRVGVAVRTAGGPENTGFSRPPGSSWQRFDNTFRDSHYSLNPELTDFCWCQLALFVCRAWHTSNRWKSGRGYLPPSLANRKLLVATPGGEEAV